LCELDPTISAYNPKTSARVHGVSKNYVYYAAAVLQSLGPEDFRAVHEGSANLTERYEVSKLKTGSATTTPNTLFPDEDQDEPQSDQDFVNLALRMIAYRLEKLPTGSSDEEETLNDNFLKAISALNRRPEPGD
jgi:hypothetical protein